MPKLAFFFVAYIYIDIFRELKYNKCVKYDKINLIKNRMGKINNQLVKQYRDNIKIIQK